MSVNGAYGLQGANAPIMINGKLAGNIGAAGKSVGGSETPFTTMFQDALQNVQEQDAVKNSDSYNLAIGDVDDLGELMTNSTRAQVAFELLVQMRNKVLDSYQEIMRMNV